jgi:hypothetical protein
VTDSLHVLQGWLVRIVTGYTYFTWIVLFRFNGLHTVSFVFRIWEMGMAAQA